VCRVNELELDGSEAEGRDHDRVGLAGGHAVVVLVCERCA
jgi:hypothetical protein